ncbi:MAG: CsbD family protein [Candidatus Contendobacter sp.]|nr:MAG: CsbD family protein [Candidatus Contendobacter sp.]
MSDPKIDKAKGQIKEAVGKVTGDKQLEAEGQVEQASAAVREKAAEITADVAEAVGNVIERAGAVAADLKDKVTGKG